MKGYIVERYNNMNNLHTSSRLVEEADKLGIALDIMGVCDTYQYDGCLYNSKNKVEFRDFSIIRYKEGNMRNLLAASSLKQYNSLEQVDAYCDKYIQLQHVASKSMTIPKYVLSYLKSDIDDIIDYMGMPFVVKSLRGSRGNEVYLVCNQDEYKDLRRIYEGVDREFLFEEYIKESSGRDIRVFCICGEVAACMKRTSRDGFRANYKLGGDVERYDIDDDIVRIAKDVYDATSLYYTGIDLLFGRDGYVFCEANICPGFEGIEKACGINIAGRLLTFIKDDLSKSAEFHMKDKKL